MKILNLNLLAILLFVCSCKQSNESSNSNSESMAVSEPTQSKGPNINSTPLEDDNDNLPKKGGKLFIFEPTFDFGTVKEGTPVVKEFKVKNEGTEPIHIASVTASCGCTVPEKPDGPIMPGEESSIKVNFNSANRVGQNNKTVTILSDASNSPSTINFKINVEK